MSGNPTSSRCIESARTHRARAGALPLRASDTTLRLTRIWERVVFAIASVAPEYGASHVILNSPMSRILRYVELTMIWTGAVCAMAGCARPTAPVPVVVLEATHIHHG